MAASGRAEAENEAEAAQSSGGMDVDTTIGRVEEQSIGAAIRKKPPLMTGQDSQVFKARLLRYVPKLILCQHRVFLCCVVIVRTEVRFVHCDRIGILVEVFLISRNRLTFCLAPCIASLELATQAIKAMIPRQC